MKDILSFLIAILVLGLSPVSAGSNTAHITGKTSSERTSLEIDVWDIEGVFSRVKLTIDGESYEMTSGEELVIRDQKNGVYILALENKTHSFTMWMVPNTEKVLIEGNGHYKSTFAAVIEATDPRKGSKWELTPRITIGCRLNWQI